MDGGGHVCRVWPPFVLLQYVAATTEALGVMANAMVENEIIADDVADMASEGEVVENDVDALGGG